MMNLQNLQRIRPESEKMPETQKKNKSKITAGFLKEMDVNVFNFSFNHSLGEMRRLAGDGVVLLGNIPPRDVLAAGTPEQIREAVRKASDEISNHDRIIWSAGGGMPQDVSTQNINAFIEAVKEIKQT